MKRSKTNGLLAVVLVLVLLVGPGCAGMLGTFMVYQLVGAAGAIAQSLIGTAVSGVSGQLTSALAGQTATSGT